MMQQRGRPRKIVASSKYAGVSYELLKNGDISYHIKVQKNGFNIHKSVGLASSGMNEDKANEIAVQIGEFCQSTSQDVKSNLDKFLEQERPYVSPSTQRSRRTIVSHINAYFGEMKVTRVNIDDVFEFISYLKRRNISQPYTVGILSFLSRFFKYMVENHILSKNPCSDINMKKIKCEPRCFSKEELGVLFNALLEDKMLFVFCLLVLKTGASLNSVYAIKRDDLKENCIISVPNLKSRKRQSVLIGEQIYSIVHDFCKYYDIQGPLFHITRQVNIHYKIQLILDNLFNRDIIAKKRKATVHTFRSTFDSIMAQAGVPLDHIQKCIDEKRLDNTMVGAYLKVSKTAIDDAIDFSSFTLL